MKLRGSMMLISLSVLLAVNASAGNLRSRFELERHIDGTFETGQRGRIVVPGEVFGQARSFPNDLRIFADDGIQWPFFLHVPQEQDVDKTLIDILNPSWIAGPERYLQFDVVVPEADGRQPIHNRLELFTTGRDFVRRVEIFTVGEGRSMGHLASGYLVDFSSQRNARNKWIRYPESDVARLHVRVYPNAQSATETFTITSARVQRYVETVRVRETVEYTELAVGSREEEKGAQTSILDIGQSGRPVEFMTFAVSNPSFARCVSVYGRDTDRDVWQWVGGGEIHVLPGDRVDTVKLHARSRYLKVHVFHYDDQPLDIDALRLEAIPRYLVFEAATEGQADLFYRAWDINAPRYDLQGRIKKEAIDNLPIYNMLPSTPNESAKVMPWRRYAKLLGTLAVAAVSLLVVWIIVSMLRQQTFSDNHPAD